MSILTQPAGAGQTATFPKHTFSEEFNAAISRIRPKASQPSMWQRMLDDQLQMQEQGSQQARERNKEKRSRGEKSRAYKTKRYVVTKRQAEVVSVISSMLDGEDERTKEATVALFLHILNCSLKLRKSDNGWVPICSEFINKHYRYAKPYLLYNAGLVERTNYDKGKGKSREYRVVDCIATEFADRGLQDWDEADSEHPIERYDVVSGDKIVKSVLVSTTRDESGDTQIASDLVKSHIGAYKTHCLFNKQEAVLHLKRLREAQGKARSAVEVAKERYGEYSPEYDKVLRQYNTAHGRYISDTHNLRVVMNECGATHYIDDLWVYKAPYEPQKTGRISHRGGGFQSATRQMKRAIHSSIPDRHNYDLKSSQAKLMLQFFQQAEIQCGWLKDYIDKPNAKNVIASVIGVDVDTWKQMLCALEMGGSAPEYKGKIPTRNVIADAANVVGGKPVKCKHPVPKIQIYCIEAAEWDIDRATDYYLKFLQETVELRQAIRLWHQYLLSTYCPAKGRDYVAKIENASGMSLKCRVNAKGEVEVEGAKEESCGPAGLIAAHLLQGKEAALIANIVLLQDKYGFQVVQNEHDGFVCQGQVAEEAVIEAAKACGAPLDIQLVEKEYV